ncbi:MAG TPA: outer membrane beta-barrel protein, partial [Chitinophaga sp.]|uniref:outer membrane beta-barrel protein n=1 Tax=Chitinophaga sp. TaxID=1869181 RepID=UPI002C940C82
AQKIINIQLKKDASHGYFVKLQNGIGTDQRYDLANAFSYFDDAQQASAFVNSNNVNNSGLSRSLNSPYFGNLSRLVGTNKNIVEGLGGAGGASSLVNNQDFGFLNAVPDYGNGTADNTSVGVRYSIDRSKRFSFYGSYLYFYSRRQFNYTAAGKELFDPPQIIDQRETLTSSTNTGAHRAFMNVAYKPDSSFSVRLIPSLQWSQENMNASPQALNLAANTKINATASDNEISTRKDQLSLNLVVKKKFGKTGRSLFFESVFESRNNNGEAHNQNIFFTPAFRDTSLQRITDEGSYSAYDNKLLFTAPLSKKLMYQVYYSYRYSRSNTGRNTAFFDNTTGKYQTNKAYSGNIISVISTNTGGAMLKLLAGKTTYTAGAAVQTNRFERTGDMLPPYHQTTVNFLPLLQADYKISGTAALQVLYNGMVRPADPSQLLPVTDTSNPLIVFRGNIRLKPEFTNSLHVSYYRFSFIDGGVLLLHASYVHVLNKIIPAVELSSDGKTLVSLVNTAYNRDISIYYNISRPFFNKTFEITWGGNISTSRYAFYNNGTHVINTFRINQGLEFAYNRDRAEFTVGAGLNTQHFLFKQRIEPVTDLSFTQRTSFYFTGWKAGTDLSLIIPSGYLLPHSGNTIWLMNAYVERSLTKRLLVKVSVNDLLNRSTWNYNRVVRDNYVTDYQYNVPGRYLLLFVTYKLSRFR